MARKFQRPINLIKNAFTGYLNSIQNFFKLSKFKRQVSKIKVVNTTLSRHNDWITSLCLLKDKRLVSGSLDGSIIIYNRTYDSQSHIDDPHNGRVVSSLCLLRSGELASTGGGEIKIWIINEEDYELVHTLTTNNESLIKVIELKDGKLCSCSKEEAIRIWDNYKCIQTFKGHNHNIISIIEINNYLISLSYSDNALNVWDRSACQSITTFTDVNFSFENSLSKFNDNTLLLGQSNVITVVDVQTFKMSKISIESVLSIYCLDVLRNGIVLIGSEGNIIFYDLLSNKIIFQKKIHKDGDSIKCLIHSEDNKIFSCSFNYIINVYDY